MRNTVFILLVAFFVIGCNQKPEEMIPFIEGYWEISEVKKDGNKLKEFTINTVVDYFEIQEDQTGFRKKLSPTLDGRFQGSEHQTSFQLITTNGALIIEYEGSESRHRETVKKANEKELVLLNDSGFVYIYKPYTPIKID